MCKKAYNTCEMGSLAMVKKILGGCLILIMFFQTGCGRSLPAAAGKSIYREKGVSVVDKGNYFYATLDYTSGLTRLQMGKAFARGILQVVPDYRALIDSYIAETFKNEYHNSFYWVENMKPQLDPDIRDEIDGMAAVLANSDEDMRQDGKLSKDEVYLFNLIPDISDNTQCCSVSVFGSRSATHHTITGRNLDWYGGSMNQLPRIQAVMNIKYPDKKLCSIGYLGFMGILTGFNDSKVFAAVQVSLANSIVSSIGKRSFPLDLRSALEGAKTLNDAAEFMGDTTKLYALDHLIVLSDPDETKVLENNLDGFGANGQRVRRSLRSADSRLNRKVSWGISDAIGCVNSFLLDGNYDNHTGNKYNTLRWKNMKEQLAAQGSAVSPDGIKKVISYDNGSPGTFMDSGDLYNRMTLQMVLFQPDSLSLEVFFRPKNNVMNPDNPVFEKIPVFQ